MQLQKPMQKPINLERKRKRMESLSLTDIQRQREVEEDKRVRGCCPQQTLIYHRLQFGPDRHAGASVMNFMSGHTAMSTQACTRGHTHRADTHT